MQKILFLLPLIFALLVSGTVEAKKKKYPNGDYYEGGWKKGLPDGTGTMYYFNGDIYSGNWKVGRKNGEGIMTYSNGDVYIGSWSSDCRNGVGKLIKKDRVTFEGVWNYEKFESGKRTNSKGEVFEGKWKQGVLYNGTSKGYINNTFYDGLWSEGKFYKGICIGNLTDSLWCNGEIKDGKIIKGKCKGYINGNYYDGEWVNGFFVGKCKFKSINKDIVSFEGSISADSIMSGYIIYADGSKYNGTMKNYKRIGEGSLTINSTTLHGNWSNDMLINGYGSTKIDKSGECFTFIIKNEENNSCNMQLKNRFGRLINTTFPSCPIAINSILAQLNIVGQKLLSQTLAEEKSINNQQRQQYIAQKTKSFNIHSYLWSVSDINRLKQHNIAKFSQVLKGEKVLLYGTIADFFTGEGDNTAAAYWSNGLLPSTYKQYFIQLQGGAVVQAHSNEIADFSRGETIFIIADLREDEYRGYVFDARYETITTSLTEMKKKLCEPLGDGVQPKLEYESMKLVKNIYR